MTNNGVVKKTNTAAGPAHGYLTQHILQMAVVIGGKGSC